MSRKKLHMKIKRIFCGVLAAGMLLGQTGAVWAEATDTPANDTAASSPTRIPNITHSNLTRIPSRAGRWVLRSRHRLQFLWI